MGCCLLAVTNYVDRAFTGFLLPLVGLIFLPFTTIMFSLVYSPVAGGVVGANWIWVAPGLLFDIMSHSSGGYGQRRRSTAG